jgi:hypothetical protein
MNVNSTAAENAHAWLTICDYAQGIVFATSFLHRH